MLYVVCRGTCCAWYNAPRGILAADKGMVPEGSGMAHLLMLPLQLLASGEMKL